MANPEHLKILKQGVEVWNKWREENPEVQPDLSEADLGLEKPQPIQIKLGDPISFPTLTIGGRNFNLPSFNNINFNNSNLKKINLSGIALRNAELRGANLSNADLSKTDLSESDLSESILVEAQLIETKLWSTNLLNANLSKATLRGAWFSNTILTNTIFNNADLRGVKFLFYSIKDRKGMQFKGANLQGEDLSFCDLRGLDMREANLNNTNLMHTNLWGANLKNSDLQNALLVEANFNQANIEGTKIYGISAWDIKKDGLIQKDLIITPPGDPEITVDDLEVAQFIYLLLNNQNIRNVIDTITSKAVLILGRFTEERKQVLDALKNELRRRNYLPIVFDFDPLQSRDITETVSILAKMSRFVVADLSDPRSIPQELREIVPNTPSLPIVPIILDSQREYGMFEHFTRYPWVLPVYRYASQASLLDDIVPAIITPAEQKVEELRRK